MSEIDRLGTWLEAPQKLCDAIALAGEFEDRVTIGYRRVHEAQLARAKAKLLKLRAMSVLGMTRGSASISAA